MISKKDCARVVDAFLDAVKEALKNQHNIEVRGFGTFKIRRRKTRMARNPRTGDPVEVAARPVPVFKPSKELRALVADEPFDPRNGRRQRRLNVRVIQQPEYSAGRVCGPAPTRLPSCRRYLSAICRVRVLLFATYADLAGRVHSVEVPVESGDGRRCSPSAPRPVARSGPASRAATRGRQPGACATRSRVSRRGRGGASPAAGWRLSQWRATLTRTPIELGTIDPRRSANRRGAGSRRSSDWSAITRTGGAYSGWSTPPTSRWPRRNRERIVAEAEAPLAGASGAAAPARELAIGEVAVGVAVAAAHRARPSRPAVRDRGAEAAGADLEEGVLRRRDCGVGGSDGTSARRSAARVRRRPSAMSARSERPLAGGDGPAESPSTSHRSRSDQFAARSQSLRISVTDRCNMRCGTACRRTSTSGLPRESLLTFEEIDRLAGIFVELGVSKIRLTGGEPLLRHDLPVLVGLLGRLAADPRPGPDHQRNSARGTGRGAAAARGFGGSP